MPPKPKSKPQSGSKQPATLKTALTRIQSLNDKVARLESEVRGLKDLLNVHDNWASETRKLIGASVNVGAVGSSAPPDHGTLRWVDRYNICVEVLGKRRIYSKGGIWIEPFVPKSGE